MLATWMVDVYKFSRSAQKSTHMPCVPQKPMCFTCFLCFLFVVLAAERLGKEGTRSKKQGQNKAPKRVTNNKIDRFSNLSNVTSKITWQNGLPESPREPPESSRGPPGRPKTVPKSALSAPGRAQEPPRALQELPRNSFGAVLAATWRRPVAQRLRQAILTSRELDFGPSGGQFSRSPALHLEPSGEHFRLLSGLEPSMPKPPALAAARCNLTKNRLPKKSASPWEARTQGLPFP